MFFCLIVLIQIVGAEGTGKHDLAKGLVGVKTSFSLGV